MVGEAICNRSIPVRIGVGAFSRCGNHGWVFLHIVPHLGQNKMKFLKSLPAVFQSKINWLWGYSSNWREQLLCTQTVMGSSPISSTH